MKFLSFTYLNVVSILYGFPQSVAIHSMERKIQWKVSETVCLSESVCLMYVFQRRPWLVGIRRSSLNRRTQRKQLRRRKVKERIRRLQPKQRWSTHVLSAGHRCQTPRPLNSTLKANTQSLLCLLSWWMFKPKGCKETNMDLKQRPWGKKHDSTRPTDSTCCITLTMDHVDTMTWRS